MSQLGKFIIIFITLLTFLEFVGVPTPIGNILDNFGIQIGPTSDLIKADLENSNFWDEVFLKGSGILLVVGATGLAIIGFFARSYDTSLIVLPFIVSIGTSLTATAWGIISFVNDYNAGGWLTKIIAIVFIGLGIGFIMACIDYFRTGQ